MRGTVFKMLSIRAVVFDKDGPSEGWSFIKVVYHCSRGMVSDKGGLSEGWSLIKVVYQRGGLS